VLKGNGATVIIDYGHNPSAVACLIEALAIFPHRRRSIIFSAEGDRRDEDVIRQMQMLGDAFDTVIIHEYDERRGRAKGAILALLRNGLAMGTRVSSRVEADGEPAAVALALEALEPGDLLVVQPKAIDDVIDQVQRFLQQDPPKPPSPRRHAAERPVLAAQVID
jgi:cyanophycin synthetase